MHRVVFDGIAPGANPGAVISNLAGLFKARPEQVERLLRSPGTVVKKGLELPVAQRYEQALRKAGALCRIEADVQAPAAERREAGGTPGPSSIRAARSRGTPVAEAQPPDTAGMSIPGVLGRFVGAYLALLVAAAVAFPLLGITPNSGVNVGIVVGAVLWSCLAFGTKNGRYFTASEKRKVVWGMIGIDLLMQVVIGGAALAARGTLDAGALELGLLLVVGVIHGLTIAFTVAVARRHLDRRLRTKVAPGD